jgi:hypothetical protein
MAIDGSSQNMVRFVDLAIAEVGLDWPVVPCRPWVTRQAKGSTLVQHKYLTSCRTMGFPHIS